LVSPETPPGAYPRYLMLVRVYEEVDEPLGWTIELHKCQRPEGNASDVTGEGGIAALPGLGVRVRWS